MDPAYDPHVVCRATMSIINRLWPTGLLLLALVFPLDWLALASEPSTNRVARLEGFMRKTRVLSVDQSMADKLSSVIPRMRRVLEVGNKTGGPVNIEEAAEHFRKNIVMIAPPNVCVEYSDVFFFSWDRLSDRAEDFNTGFAIRKGEGHIYSWDDSVCDPGKKSVREDRP